MGTEFEASCDRRAGLVACVAVENPHIARLKHRAIIIVVVGAVIYGAGVLAIASAGAWNEFPSWYRSLLSLQDGESICALTGLPMEQEAGSGAACNGKRNEALTQHLSSVNNGIAEAANHVAYWHRTRATIADECARSLRRQCQLMSALDAQGSGAQFAESRKLLNEERARFEQLADQERSTRIARYDIAVRVVLGFIDAFVAWLAVFLLARSGNSAFTSSQSNALNDFESLEQTRARDDVVERWKAPFAAFTGAGILTAIATLSGGISVDDKLWIGADSWVVSRPLWFCNLASMSGIVIAFAAPMTFLWQLGHCKFMPVWLKLNSADGQCGVGGYVSFLHTWTILSFALAIGPAILWIRFLRVDVSSHPTYLAPVGAALVLTALLVGRLVTNAIRLRATYHQAIAATATTWDPDEAKKWPADPTIPFIGENWWKLPATFAAIALALWQILEWTGAAHAIAAVAGK